MIKWFVAACIFIANQSVAQEISWEKVQGSDIVNYESNDLVVDSRENLWLTGRYETGLEFFVTENGVVRYADSTLPHGTYPFVQKLDQNGKLLKQVLLPGIEGERIIQLNDNRFAVCGFMNGYREKNYDRDRAQGVFLMLLDSSLRRLTYREYPSFYNSTAFGMIPDGQGGLVIAARSFTEPDPKMGINDVFSLRLIHTDSKGNPIRDTTFRELNWVFKQAKFLGRRFDPAAISSDSNGIWLAGDIKGMDSTYSDRSALAWVQLDEYYRPGANAAFSNRTKNAPFYESMLTDLVVSEKYVFTVGQDLHQKPDQTYVFLFDSKGNKLYQKSCKGDFGEAPVVTRIDEQNWAVLTKSKEDRFLVSFFNTEGLVKELAFSQENCRDPKALVCSKNTLYCIGDIRENGLRKTWISKVRLKP
jgi:hypothetical protein